MQPDPRPKTIATPRRAPVAPPVDPRTVRILNVDDNEAGRYTKTHWLRTAGYVVLQAGTGADALRIVAEQRPDLVILDVKLPDVDGFEVCRRIKSNSDTASIAVLQVSATFVNDAARVHGLEQGADNYLVMPTEPEVLLASVRALLRLRAAEEAARRSGEKAHSVLASITDAYFALDREWRFTSLNPKGEEFFGRAADELLGRQIWEEFPEILGGPLSGACRRAAAAREPIHLEERSQLNGRWYEVHVYPGDEGIEVYLRDIHDRRTAEEELRAAKAAAEQASRAKDSFLAVLSHELRTPLTPVLAAVSMLQKGQLANPQEVQESLEIIRRNIETEARLIDDLLDVTRIAHDKVHLTRQPVELCQVVERAVEVCGEDFRTQRLHLDTDLQDCPILVTGDPGRLQQVFWNLIKNATKFTPPGGRVSVRCRRAGERAVVEVQDTGVGIEPELIGRIFDAFEQAEVGRTRRFGGLGLGLTITKALVAVHGGTIAAQSAGVNQGATFRVELPVCAPAAARPCEPAPPPRSAKGQAGARILLVEDHKDTARIMERVLRSAGHAVATANDVASALARAEGEEFDLLISDLGLPDRSGLDLMRELRARGNAMPAIAMTGYGQEEDVARTRAAGFTLHLTKPIDLDKLEGALADVLRA